MEDITLNLLAILILVLPIFSVWAAYRLWTIARKHKDIAALQERALSARILALASLVGGLFGLARLTTAVTGSSFLGRDLMILSLVTLILLTSIPNIIWLLKYRRSGFTSGPDDTQ